LEKGESKTVEVPIEVKYAASFWDEVRNAWITEKDEYAVLVGTTSKDVPLKETFTVEKTTWWNGI